MNAEEVLIEISRQLGRMQGLIESDHADHKAIWQELVDLRRTLDESVIKLDAIGDIGDIKDNSELISKIRRRVILVTSAVSLLSFTGGAVNADAIAKTIKIILGLSGG